jgi:hypothetical protein
LVQLRGLIQGGSEVLGLLIVKFRGLIERDLEILNLLGEPVEQLMTFAGFSGPRACITHEKNYIMTIP